MKTAINPIFGDDGTFWMNFKDFCTNFRALNVCKVSDWEEVRVKGELSSKLSDLDNTVRSKYYYELSVTQKQRVLIGIH
jgi:calpain-15